MNGELQILDDEQALFAAAAATFADAVRSVLAVRPRCTVALSGGSTPRSLFQRLTAAPHFDRIPWRQIDFFWGDERNVGPDDPDSNYRLARESLLSKIDADPARIFRMRVEAESLAKAAAEYEETLAKVLGAPLNGPPPALDLVLLGMGGDGHTASLFPFTGALEERKRWVVANDVPQLNTKRLTMTYPLLNAASCVLFMITGAGKAKVLREVLEGPNDPRRLPSQGIHPLKGRLIWQVEKAAASQLELKQ